MPRTFQPVGHRSGTIRERLHAYTKRTLGAGGSYMDAVGLPDGESCAAWVAVHAIDYYNDVATIWAVISTDPYLNSFRPGEGFPSRVEYRWSDGPGECLSVSAPTYIDKVLVWMTEQINDESKFPDGEDETEVLRVCQTPQFAALCGQMYRRIFRVYAIMYASFFGTLEALDLSPHLNACFKHFMFFCTEFGLLQQRETEPMKDLVKHIWKKYYVAKFAALLKYESLEETADTAVADPQSEIYKGTLSEVRQNGGRILYAPLELRADRDIALAACEHIGILLLCLPSSLQADKEIVLVACRRDGLALEYAAPTLQNDKDVVLAACKDDGLALKYCAEPLRNDRDIVMAACRKNCWALHLASQQLQSDKEMILGLLAEKVAVPLDHVSEELRDDKDVILEACLRSGDNLKSASDRLRADKEVVVTACRIAGRALQHAETSLQNDKEVVLVACRQNGLALDFGGESLKHDEDIVLAACKANSVAFQYASPELRADKDFVIRACRQNGSALQYAQSELQSDRDVVLVASQQSYRGLKFAAESYHNNQEVVLEAVKRDWRALEFASEEIQSNKDVVWHACSQNGPGALRWAAAELRDDEDVVLAACRQNGWAVNHSSLRLKENKEIVLAAVNQNGSVLQTISHEMRSNKEIVLAAVASDPTALKYALGGLSQDSDCLVAAGLWDEDRLARREDAVVTSPGGNRTRKIVLSTRFALTETSPSKATQFALLLKQHYFSIGANFEVYSPNAFAKSTCDPEWTSYEWPCRGTFETCKKAAWLKTGAPRPESCWRYSFRWQLEQAKLTDGFMIQLVECPHVDESGFTNGKPQTLGDGQKIEVEMADQLAVKLFQVYAPIKDINQTFESEVEFDNDHIEGVIRMIQYWYDGDRMDMKPGVCKSTDT